MEYGQGNMLVDVTPRISLRTLVQFSHMCVLPSGQAELSAERGLQGGHRHAVLGGMQSFPGTGVRWPRAALPH